MHIDINGGNLFGGASINDFQVDLNQFIGNSNDILSVICFHITTLHLVVILQASLCWNNFSGFHFL